MNDKKKPKIDVRKSDIHREVAARSGFTIKEVHDMLNLIQTVVFEHLRDGDAVQLFKGFALYTVYRPARPFSGNFKSQVGNVVMTNPRRLIKFFAGRYMKEFINSSADDDITAYDEEDDEYGL